MFACVSWSRFRCEDSIELHFDCLDITVYLLRIYACPECSNLFLLLLQVHGIRGFDARVPRPTMSRRVRRKGTQVKARRPVSKGKWNNDPCEYEEEEIIVSGDRDYDVDWTCLPDNTVIAIFSLLNYRDRASLACVCKSWRSLASSPWLWNNLDLRAHHLKAIDAKALACRCANLQSLRFRGADSADVIIYLQARNLKEIHGEFCRELTDATLSMLAARHETLECLQLGPDYCDRISSDAIRVLAMCWPRLRRLRVSGLRKVDFEAIRALGKHCPDLVEIGFLDCSSIDERAFGNVTSLKFLSVAGSKNVRWGNAASSWNSLPNLCGLDVSRTYVPCNVAQSFLASSQNLRVLCALNCQHLEGAGDIHVRKPKIMLARSTDMMEELKTLKPTNIIPAIKEACTNATTEFWNVENMKTGNRSLVEMTEWLEWVLSHSLLRIAESNAPGLDNFWIKQGAPLLLSLVRSSQEDVQERAATGLATFVVSMMKMQMWILKGWWQCCAVVELDIFWDWPVLSRMRAS